MDNWRRGRIAKAMHEKGPSVVAMTPGGRFLVLRANNRSYAEAAVVPKQGVCGVKAAVSNNWGPNDEQPVYERH